MSYKSIVLIKQVPDTKNITGDVMKEDGTVNRAAMPAIFNPEDLHALEAALALRDEHGGTVTVLTMGPPKAADVLRGCNHLPTSMAPMRQQHSSDYIYDQAPSRFGTRWAARVT